MSFETSFGSGAESHETKQYPEIQLSPFYVNEVGENLDVREQTVYEIGDPKLFTFEELYAQIVEDFDNVDKDAAKNLANQVREKYHN